MKVEVNEQFKFAYVWLSNKDKNNQAVKKELQPLMSEYKKKKYKFVIYESGESDLLEQTKCLLSHNKNLQASEI